MLCKTAPSPTSSTTSPHTTPHGAGAACFTRCAPTTAARCLPHHRGIRALHCRPRPSLPPSTSVLTTFWCALLKHARAHLNFSTQTAVPKKAAAAAAKKPNPAPALVNGFIPTSTPSPAETALPTGPGPYATSPSGPLDTLLPGYLSRPITSPGQRRGRPIAAKAAEGSLATASTDAGAGLWATLVAEMKVCSGVVNVPFLFLFVPLLKNMCSLFQNTCVSFLKNTCERRAFNPGVHRSSRGCRPTTSPYRRHCPRHCNRRPHAASQTLPHRQDDRHTTQP